MVDDEIGRNRFVYDNASYHNFHKATQTILSRDERNYNDIIKKMSRSMASNQKDFKNIYIADKLICISQRQFDDFYSTRHNKSHLPQVIHSLQPVYIFLVDT